jgi:hypothetical protein
LTLIENIAANAKASGAIAAGTITSGFASFVGLIPEDIGKAVSLVGGILSLVMIQYWRRNTKKLEIETQILMIQLEREMREAAHQRRATDIDPTPEG